MIYLDSAAVIKMIRVEPGTAELVAWLNERSDLSMVSSVLVEVEIPRALRRTEPAALAGMPSALSHLYRFEIDTAVRATAAAFADPHLRSLDAIHLATAQILASDPENEFEAFVAYDERLLNAAGALGLPVESSGGS